MGNVKLKRLRIEKYRNVAPGTELVFNDGFNVLLGQNGTGKTTLLNLIAMVTASRFGSLKDTEFSLSYTLGHAGASVVVAIENARNHPGPLFGDPFTWSFSLSLTVDGLSDVWTIRGTAEKLLLNSGETEGGGANAPAVSPFERPLLAYTLIPLIVLLGAETRKKHATAIFNLITFEAQSIANGRRFDELLGGLNSITGEVSAGDSPAASFQCVHYTKDVESRERDRPTFIPKQLEAMMSAHEPPSRSLDPIVAKHENVGFLAKAVHLMAFKRAEMLLRLRKREPVGGGERLTYGNFEFTMTLDDDTVIPHDALSYGQKRLLAFLYYVAANDDVIVADEIVNGMHYDWIEACLREIGDRQSFLTSQNPLLLDFLPFTSADQVEHTFVLCRTEKNAGRTHVAWSNLSQRDARAFYRAYETGAMHVSEILRSKGLW